MYRETAVVVKYKMLSCSGNIAELFIEYCLGIIAEA